MAGIKIKRNDTVEVIAGKDKGKRGRVLRIIADKDRLLVEHVMMIKKHVKPNPQKNIKGGIAEQEASINLSNVLLVCSSCGKPTRAGYKFDDAGNKSRTCGKCGAEVTAKKK
jgi:large subunit ribosomal protein L24